MSGRWEELRATRIDRAIDRLIDTGQLGRPDTWGAEPTEEQLAAITEEEFALFCAEDTEEAEPYPPDHPERWSGSLEARFELPDPFDGWNIDYLMARQVVWLLRVTERWCARSDPDHVPDTVAVDPEAMGVWLRGQWQGRISAKRARRITAKLIETGAVEVGRTPRGRIVTWDLRPLATPGPRLPPATEHVGP